MKAHFAWRGTLLVAIVVLATASRSAAAPVLSFEINCGTSKVGKITIDKYESYKEKISGSNYYGVEIKGGFDAATGPGSCILADGAKYYWIQAYIGKPTLWSWEKEDKWSYDRTRDATDDKLIKDGSPFYVNLRGPGYGHSTLGYQDIPRDNRLSDGKPIEFLFQTALVCAIEGKDGKKGDIHLIDGFTWGFKWEKDKDGNEKYTATNPAHSTAHFGDLVNAFKNDPDKKTLSDSWNIHNDGSCCCVPEPTSVALMGIGLATGALYRRRLAGRRSTSASEGHEPCDVPPAC